MIDRPGDPEYAEWERWQKKLREAEARSIELLKAWLSPEQLSEYEATGMFHVTGNVTGTVYRLHNSRVYNVVPLRDGAPFGGGYCVTPDGDPPIGDHLLAQKIWLETDETETLAVANKAPMNSHFYF